MKKLPEKRAVRITVFVIFLMIVSVMVFEYRAINLVADNQWSVYFVDTPGSVLDFTINNQSPSKAFSWSLSDGVVVLEESSAQVYPRDTQDIPVNFQSTEKKELTRYSIEVTDEIGNTRSIYKNL